VALEVMAVAVKASEENGTAHVELITSHSVLSVSSARARNPLELEVKTPAQEAEVAALESGTALVELTTSHSEMSVSSARPRNQLALEALLVGMVVVGSPVAANGAAHVEPAISLSEPNALGVTLASQVMLPQAVAVVSVVDSAEVAVPVVA